MSLPPEKPKPGAPSLQRVVIWVIVGAVGLSLLLSGITGIVAKGG